MAVFLLLPALVLLGVILLAPLMLPGALVVIVALGIGEGIRRHHQNRALRLH